ncbi:MAG: hypothetical protein HY903_24590 [Deltaproteobacteria bacterium]|nr:hypothetical protein [Deltaproteobacteria bacterium]
MSAASRRCPLIFLAALAGFACEPEIANPLDPSRGPGFNTAPLLAAVSPLQVATGERLVVRVETADLETDRLVVSASGLPVGAVFDGATGLLAMTPTASQVGEHRISFTASDGQLTAATELLVTVVDRGPDALQLLVVSGDRQHGTFDAPLADFLVVRVMADGQPVTNTRVAFALLEGDGQLGVGGAADEDVTDAAGLARSRLALGSACAYRVRATLLATGVAVDLTATAGVGALELPCTLADDDCNAASADNPDADEDGYGACVDCDDGDPLVHPLSPGTCLGPFAADRDRDEHAALTWGGDDCNDEDAGVNPDADEICDAVDQDCDGDPVFVDLDDDGLVDVDCGGDDCVDNAAQLCRLYGPLAQGGTGLFDPCDAFSFSTWHIGPGLAELCDQVDNDCDGIADDGDGDGDGFGVCSDCNDQNPRVFPGAMELCNGIDDDCDQTADEVVDADGDGVAGIACGGTDCIDNMYQFCAVYGPAADGGSGLFDPCAFGAYNHPELILPGAPELCDEIDNDCNGLVDDVDQDQDGYVTAACVGGTDCVDALAPYCAVYAAIDPGCASGTVSVDFAAIHPGAPEVCDRLDNNCAAGVDEVTDGDGDGEAGTFCGGSDCDDANANVRAGLVERCGDGLDNDCSGVAEDKDQDNDGEIDQACGGADCNDANAAVKPGALEVCDGIDNDCDTATDLDDVATNPAAVVPFVSRDTDVDGFDAVLCGGADCNDLDNSVYPGAPELCDTKDNDCNGAADDADQDADGHAPLACILGDDCVDDYLAFCALYGDPPGSGLFPGCNASVAFDFGRIHAGAPEYCDGIDSNCVDDTPSSGAVDPSGLDGDGDGQAGALCGGTDCDDSDLWTHLGAAEFCDDVDTNCIDDTPTSNRVDPLGLDGDGDTVVGVYCGGFDCNDRDPSISPLAQEACDQIDNDCDGLVDEEIDGDADNFVGAMCGGTDCDDLDPNVFPATTNPVAPGGSEVCDGKDNDCDGTTNEPAGLDGDGDSHPGKLCGGDDCNDADAAVYPGRPEVCFDGLDQDCDPAPAQVDCADAASCADNGGVEANASFDLASLIGFNAAGDAQPLATFDGYTPKAGARMAVLKTGAAALKGKLSGLVDCSFNFPANSKRFMLFKVAFLTAQTPGDQVCNDRLTITLGTPAGPRVETFTVAGASFVDTADKGLGTSPGYFETGWFSVIYGVEQFYGARGSLEIKVEDQGPCANDSIALIDNIIFTTTINPGD